MDGQNVLVNGIPVSTLEHRKQTVDVITRKGQFAIELVKIIGEMKFYHFWIESNELKHIFKFGKLSVNSIRIIKEEKRPLTQNFYYDMLFDDISSYSEMLKIKNNCESTSFVDKKILR